MINKQKLLIFIVGVILLMFITKCLKEQSEPITVGELAYDVNEIDGYTIYIKENNQYVPYLVLTDDYAGNALLLREEILDHRFQFSKSSDGDNDYYADSFVDDYLNSEFYNCFSDAMKNAIVNAEIQISRDYPDIFETEEIVRKIFLLSCTELNINLGVTIPEGVPLKYFTKKNHMLCQKEGKFVGWWLRSNYLPERSLVWCISAEGMLGGDGVQYARGIRPAFCVSSSTKITKKQISSDIEGYVLNVEK